MTRFRYPDPLEPPGFVQARPEPGSATVRLRDRSADRSAPLEPSAPSGGEESSAKKPPNDVATTDAQTTDLQTT